MDKIIIKWLLSGVIFIQFLTRRIENEGWIKTWWWQLMEYSESFEDFRECNN